ncbi:SDR family oxidoreductase [Bdellovibrio sp. SKB1291214]|uniref:SDR family oxidoreductase n=1 Tax=Bdellovibrio sp. SKB1291214 TaxID=1732569 RepID=UPI000B5197E0|nr:SDR family oxidoreductase [Bdellovibrio sp. SKB1291214]UYL08851.1 SDR family oxidoreductase [Bdellovibrio sp. SKB1291214]
MKVFVTGATGFVGSVVVQELLKSGHKVLGLARSEAGASQLKTAGAEVHLGDIYDLNSIKSGAEKSDGVIHTAFNHDFSKFKENCETDRAVIETLGTVLKGTDRPLVITSGAAILTPGRRALESDMPIFGPTGHPRAASEEAAQNVAIQGVRTSVVRLAPSVHGKGDKGFVPVLIGLAKEKGVSAYIEDGENKWPAIHRLDAAVLYRLALEKGAKQANYHAIAEEISFKQIAELIGKKLNLPVVSKSRQEAEAHFTWFTHFASLHAPTSNKLTQDILNWRPTQTDLLTDIQENY